MTKLEFIIFVSIVGIIIVGIFLPLHLQKREIEKILVKDYIENSLRTVGRKLDKNKMYYFDKKANKVVVIDNLNIKKEKNE